MSQKSLILSLAIYVLNLANDNSTLLLNITWLVFNIFKQYEINLLEEETVSEKLGNQRLHHDPDENPYLPRQCIFKFFLCIPYYLGSDFKY